MDPDDPFVTTPDPEAELQTLIKALTVGSGFSLNFALCNDALARDRYIERIKAAFPDDSFVEIAVPPEEYHLLYYLRTNLPEKRPRAIFVHSVENWMGASQHATEIPFFRNLNAGRDHLAEEFSLSFVFFTPIFLLKFYTEGCPDFISIRSGVYNLNTIMPSIEEKNLLIQFGDLVFAQSLLPEERDHRINEMQKNYQEYLKLPENQKNPQFEINIISHLATLYESNSEYLISESLYRKAVEIGEMNYGDSSPVTGSLINSLAKLLKDRGSYQEAEVLYQRALKIVTENLGDMHPGTGNILNNLAELFRATSRYKEAYPLYRRSIEIAENNFGPMHPDTGCAINNLALLLISENKYEESESLFLRSIEIAENNFGLMHPIVAKSINNLALLFTETGRYKEAEGLYKKALAINIEFFGIDHIYTAIDYNNLAYLFRITGNPKESEEFSRKSVNIILKNLPKDHENTKMIIGNWITSLKEAEIKNASSYSSEESSEIEKTLQLVQPLIEEDYPDVRKIISRKVR
jgi:tetratricopeptide (TPR) repeat protein